MQRPASSLARLQQAITIGLVALSLCWLLWHWNASPWKGLAGFALILLGYALILGAEFIALYLVHRHDAPDRATVRELLQAWVGEVAIAPRIFCWRQPFAWRAVPDRLEGERVRGQRGVVFIHGFVCNRGFWSPWLERLEVHGRAFAAVNLEPVFGSIDDYVPIIDRAVRSVAQATGLPPVLVCHSMGGLAARAWLRTHKDDRRVAHVITIGSPHRGTWLGRFSRAASGRQMQLDSEWVGELAKYGNAERHAGFTCWYSNCDNIVFPVQTATLPGAENRLVRGCAHVALAFHREVMDKSMERILAL